MKFKFLWIILFCMSKLMGQNSDFRLPYKVGNKYSIIDGNEKEILPSEFDDLKIDNDNKLILLSKSGLWGIYTWDGKILLNHVMTNTNKNHHQIPTIQKVKNGNSNYSRVSDSGLLAISDPHAKVVYYVNPNIRKENYKPYAVQKNDDMSLYHVNFSKINNLFKVYNRDNTVTFIDSTGTEILSEAYPQAEIINENIIGLINGDKTALFNRNKQLTDFIFKNYITRYEHSLFKMSEVTMKENGNKTYTYYAYNKDGKLIDTSSYNLDIRQEYILSNKEKGFTLYDATGKTLLTHDTYFGSFMSLGSQIWIGTRNKLGAGLMTMQGEEIFSPDYQVSYHLSEKQFVTHQNGTATAYDSLTRPLFSMKNVETIKPQKDPLYYIFAIKDSWRQKFGLVNTNLDTVVSPDWYHLSMVPCDSLVQVYDDTMQLVLRIGDKKPIIKVARVWRLEIICATEQIIMKDDKSNVRIYNFKGLLLDSFNRKERTEVNRMGPHKFLVKGNNKSFYLENREGARVLTQTFSDITPLFDEAKKESVYICQYASKVHPTTKSYNDNLKIITPEGYSVPEQIKQYNNINPGTLVVVNDSDVLKNRYNYRIGICDFQGNWLIKPFYGEIKDFTRGLFITHDFTDRKVRFYNAKGEKTCDEDFFMIEKGRGSDYFQNRILVGNLADPSYLKKVDALKLELKSLEEASRLMEKLGEPEMVYSYLDRKGKLVLDGKYVRAEPFPMRDVKTTVTVRKNGKLFSQVIDTSGHVFLEVESEGLEILKENFYSVKKDGLWAIANSDGVAQTPYQFTEINSNSKLEYFNCQHQEDRYIVDKNFRILSLGNWYNIEVSFINGYYVAKCIKQDPGTYKTSYIYKIYSSEFENMGQIEGVTQILESYNKGKLPEGYLSVCNDYTCTNSYIYDIKRKKKLVK